MKRRTVAFGAVAAGAAVGGAAAAWWKSHRAHADAVPEPFWAEVFETPNGGSFRIQAFRGRPLLLNFWATWCAPCIRELPLLDRFARAQHAAGVRVVGLAVDNREPVQAFLRQRPVVFEIGLAGGGGIGLSRTLGNDSGALPFTLWIDGAGQIRDTRLGALKEEDLRRWSSDRV